MFKNFNSKFFKNLTYSLLTLIYVSAIVLALGTNHMSTMEWSLDIPSYSYIYILISFIFSFFILSLRLKLTYRLFQHPISYYTACKFSFAGLLGGLFFFSFLGNLVGQSLASKGQNIPTSLRLSCSVFERVMMLSSGLLLCSTVMLANSQKLLFKLLAQNKILMEYLFIIPVIFFFHFYLFYNKNEQSLIKTFLSWRNIILSLTILVLSILTWFLASLAYTIPLYFSSHKQSFIDLMGASTLVAFFSSLPISVNGWGVRELASIKFFGNMGISSSTSLLVSLSVGLLSIFSVFIVGLLLKVIFKPVNSAHGSKTKTIFVENVDQEVIKFMALIASITIFFNFYVTYGNAVLNFNPTDLIALCALVIFSIMMLRKQIIVEYRIPNLEYIPFLTTFSLLVASGVGFYKFGFSSWAIVNKFMGWFVILGYVFLGLLVKIYLKEEFVKHIFKLMAVSLCTIIIFKSIKELSAVKLGIPTLLDESFYGFAFNRNAFGFQLLTVFLMFYCVSEEKIVNSKKFSNQHLILGVLIYGLIMTFSRSSQLVAIFAMTLLFTLGYSKQTIIYSAAVPLIFFSFKFVITSITGTDMASTSTPLIPYNFYSGEYSDRERWYSIVEGIKIWLDSPFLGAGLGSFISREINFFGRSLIIHNSYVWVLAEMGIILGGSFIYMGFAFSKYCLIKLIENFSFNKKLDFSEVGLLITILVIGILALAHEVLYQRIFALALGLFIVKSSSLKSQKSSHSPSLMDPLR